MRLSANRVGIIGARTILTCQLVIFFVSGSSIAWETTRPLLIPWPKEITFGKGFFIPEQKLSLINPGHDEGVFDLAETISDDLTGLGFNVKISRKPEDREGSNIILTLKEDSAFADEAYSLKVDSNMISKRMELYPLVLLNIPH